MMARVVNIAVCLMIAFDLVARPAAGACPNVSLEFYLSHPAVVAVFHGTILGERLVQVSLPEEFLLDSRLGRWPRCTLLRSGRAVFLPRLLVYFRLGEGDRRLEPGEDYLFIAHQLSAFGREQFGLPATGRARPWRERIRLWGHPFQESRCGRARRSCNQDDFRNESISACNASLVTARDIPRSVGLSTLRWDAAGPQHRHGSASFRDPTLLLFVPRAKGPKRTRSLADFLNS